MAAAVVFARSAAFALAVILITPPYAIVALLVAPLPALTRYRIVTSWSRLVVALARVICRIRYRIEGEAVPGSGPYIVMAKHQSAWETLAFQAIFPPQVLVVKRGLLWIPFFGWGLATLSPITIKRGARTQSLRRLGEQGRDRLERGFWVVIFPEGTRVQHGARGKFQSGGAWLACRSDVAVIPVAHNAGSVWARNSFLKYPGLITVCIGAPRACSGRSVAAFNGEVESWIELQMQRIGSAREAPLKPSISPPQGS
jgi:1-acyl-sn-glycerol-3-phosphate acyltransferase